MWDFKDKYNVSDKVVPQEDIEKNVDKLLPYLSYFRSYPDKFMDLISSPDCPVKLFFYQRMFLRINMRYKYVFATFNRAYAKSFLSVMTLVLKCIFYPGVKVFITAGGKELIYLLCIIAI